MSSVRCYCLYYEDPAWFRPKTSFRFLFVEEFYQVSVSPGAVQQQKQPLLCVLQPFISPPYFRLITHSSSHISLCTATLHLLQNDGSPFSPFCSSFHKLYLCSCGFKKYSFPIFFPTACISSYFTQNLCSVYSSCMKSMRTLLRCLEERTNCCSVK